MIVLTGKIPPKKRGETGAEAIRRSRASIEKALRKVEAYIRLSYELGENPLPAIRRVKGVMSAYYADYCSGGSVVITHAAGELTIYRDGGRHASWEYDALAKAAGVDWCPANTYEAGELPRPCPQCATPVVWSRIEVGYDFDTVEAACDCGILWRACGSSVWVDEIF